MLASARTRDRDLLYHRRSHKFPQGTDDLGNGLWIQVKIDALHNALTLVESKLLRIRKTFFAYLPLCDNGLGLQLLA